jgi:hypothetical protein
VNLVALDFTNFPFLPSFLRKQESGIPDENRDPVYKTVPGFRRDDGWILVFTGMTILMLP